MALHELDEESQDYGNYSVAKNHDLGVDGFPLLRVVLEVRLEEVMPRDCSAGVHH